MVDGKGNKIEVKKDCFAYRNSNPSRSEGDCRALNDLYCKKEVCRFYKPDNTKIVF